MEIYFEKLDYRHIDLGWLDWITKIDINSYTEITTKGVTRNDLEQIISSADSSDLWFAIMLVEHEDSQPQYIGNVHIGPIDWTSRVCEFGRLIGNADLRGKGIGTLIAKKTIDYCFNVLNMQRVKAGCLAVNIAAHRSNIKAGMRHEATLRREKYQNGIYHDVFYFGILNDD